MNKPKILIRGGRVVDPARGVDAVSDILIENGRIAKGSADGAEILDASGKIVCPGFVDMHAHLREPGREDEETVASGSGAAARGGYTTVLAMANTFPPADCAAVIEYIISRGRSSGRAGVLAAGALSRGLAGLELADMGELAAAGACAVSDDGKCVSSSLLMRRALEYSRMFNIPVISHCEDPAFPGVMNEGAASAALGLDGVPSCSEEIMIFRDIELARLTGGRLHIAHVSAGGSVKLIKRAKEEGLNVTAEATPHHLSLTEDAVYSFNTNFKMNPPLRTGADVIALREGLRDGVIDAVATDHAPHAEVEKEEEFASAPPGVTGLETSLGVVITELVRPGILTLPQAVSALSANPAGILGIEAGSLRPGAPADLCVFDPEKKWKVKKESFFSKSSNSPFIGKELYGIVEYTVFRGKVVFMEGRLT